MFARRRAFRGRGRGFREPTAWDRVNISVGSTGILNVPGVTTLWDPTAIIAGPQDLRLTMMRLMLSGTFGLHTTCASTGAAGDVVAVRLAMGIYMGSPSESKNPLLLATTDQQADWLWHHSYALFFTLTGAITAANFGGALPTRNLQNTIGLIDIRSKRKVDQDEQIILAYAAETSALDNNIGFNLTAASIAFKLTSSVLYKRTSR